jgi:hypothetical protein
MPITMKRRGKHLRRRWLNDVILTCIDRKGEKGEVCKSSRE